MPRDYEAECDRIGRGVVFHIAPSNNALNYAYSMAASLLAGNACIVLLPSRDFPQVDIVCEALRKTLEEESADMKDYLVLMPDDGFFSRLGRGQSDTDDLEEGCSVLIVHMEA